MNVEEIMRKFAFSFFATGSISTQRDVLPKIPPKGSPLDGSQKDSHLKGSPKGCPLEDSPKGIPLKGSPKGFPLEDSPKGIPLKGSPKGFPLEDSPKGCPLEVSLGNTGDQLFFSFTLFSNCFSTPCLLSKSTVSAIALSLCQSEKVKRIK